MCSSCRAVSTSSFAKISKDVKSEFLFHFFLDLAKPLISASTVTQISIDEANTAFANARCLFTSRIDGVVVAEVKILAS